MSCRHSIYPTLFNGYSDIVGAYNFEASNNFSLVGVLTPPNSQAQQGSPTYIVTPQGGIELVWLQNQNGPQVIPMNQLLELVGNPNYLLCISWRNQAGNVYRYALWSGVGEIFYFPVPLYTGQVIQKNFRLEVWSVTAQTSATNTVAQSLYTSVLGQYDYRFQYDMTLAGNDGEQTSFAALPITPTVLTPVTSPTVNTYGSTPQFGDWLRADTGVSGHSWTNKLTGGVENLFNGDVLTQATSQNITTSSGDGAISGKTYITGPLPIGSASINNLFLLGDPDIWTLIKYSGDGVILGMNNGVDINFSVLNGLLYYTDFSGTKQISNTQLQIGQWYVLEFFMSLLINNIAGGVGVNVWPMNSIFVNQDYTQEVNTGTSPWTSASKFYIGQTDVSSASVYVAEIITYSHVLSAADQLTNLQYFQSTYAQTYALPIIWPVGSYSAVNNTSYVPASPTMFIEGTQVFITGGGGVQGAG